MPRFLLIALESPLLAFGGEMVDAHGVATDFPLASTLTGLIANALGYDRSERDRHAALQSRLRFAARIEREGRRLVDFQTVKLQKSDRGWTTRGTPEGRDGGAATYNSPHIRYREYDADKRVVIALTLEPAEISPRLGDIANAVQAPARPLSIGRKTCLPSTYLFAGFIEADTLSQAIILAPWDEPPLGPVRILLPSSEPALATDESTLVTDERDWRAGIHSGGRRVLLRTLPETAFPSVQSERIPA
ncbi:MAG: type I-E CRISPR-associated protein Cas5/CasD [Microvirga sp.]